MFLYPQRTPSPEATVVGQACRRAVPSDFTGVYSQSRIVTWWSDGSVTEDIHRTDRRTGFTEIIPVHGVQRCSYNTVDFYPRAEPKGE